MVLPYDERRSQDIKDLIRERFWQSNYEECHALRAAMDLLENHEDLTAENARLLRVVEQAIDAGGLFINEDGFIVYVRHERTLIVGDQHTHPDLFAQLKGADRG